MLFSCSLLLYFPKRTLCAKDLWNILSPYTLAGNSIHLLLFQRRHMLLLQLWGAFCTTSKRLNWSALGPLEAMLAYPGCHFEWPPKNCDGAFCTTKMWHKSLLWAWAASFISPVFQKGNKRMQQHGSNCNDDAKCRSGLRPRTLYLHKSPVKACWSLSNSDLQCKPRHIYSVYPILFNETYSLVAVCRIALLPNPPNELHDCPGFPCPCLQHFSSK